MLIAFGCLLIHRKAKTKYFLEKQYAGARANVEQKLYGTSSRLNTTRRNMSIRVLVTASLPATFALIHLQDCLTLYFKLRGVINSMNSNKTCLPTKSVTELSALGTPRPLHGWHLFAPMHCAARQIVNFPCILQKRKSFVCLLIINFVGCILIK